MSERPAVIRLTAVPADGGLRQQLDRYREQLTDDATDGKDAEIHEAVSHVVLVDNITKMVREMLDEEVAAGRMVKVGPDRYRRVTP